MVFEAGPPDCAGDRHIEPNAANGERRGHVGVVPGDDL